MKNNNKFSWRSFISFGLLLAFILILFTGIILFLAPAGRVSNWVNWKIFGLSKGDWQAIHIVFSVFFVILSIIHLFSINWKVFLSYLKSKSSRGLNKKRELLYSSVLTILIFIGVIFSVPPFSSLLDFGEYLTKSWESKIEEPPIPHAELLTLIELSEKLNNVSLEKIKNKLVANDIKFDNTDQTLLEISKFNERTPLEIYSIITKQAMNGMAGSGMGRKSLAEIAEENGYKTEQLINLLKDHKMNATADQTLKDIAAENDIAARDIFQIIKENQ